MCVWGGKLCKGPGVGDTIWFNPEEPSESPGHGPGAFILVRDGQLTSEQTALHWAVLGVGVAETWERSRVRLGCVCQQGTHGRVLCGWEGASQSYQGERGRVRGGCCCQGHQVRWHWGWNLMRK